MTIGRGSKNIGLYNTFIIDIIEAMISNFVHTMKMSEIIPQLIQKQQQQTEVWYGS
jgi:hypothetical protein